MLLKLTLDKNDCCIFAANSTSSFESFSPSNNIGGRRSQRYKIEASLTIMADLRTMASFKMANKGVSRRQDWKDEERLSYIHRSRPEAAGNILDEDLLMQPSNLTKTRLLRRLY